MSDDPILKVNKDTNASTSAVAMQKWGGIASLFAYLLPDLEGFVVTMSSLWGFWQGILLWIAESVEMQPPDQISSQPNLI